MAIKLGRLVTYLKRLLPIKSYGSKNTWSCEITRQFKNISFTMTMFVATKLDRVVTYYESLPIQCPLIPQSRGLVNSYDKLNTLYLHFHKTYGD